MSIQAQSPKKEGGGSRWIKSRADDFVILEIPPSPPNKIIQIKGLLFEISRVDTSVKKYTVFDVGERLSPVDFIRCLMQHRPIRLLPAA